MRASLAALACLGFSRRAAAFAPAAPFVRRTTTARAPAVSAAAEEAPGPAAGSLESIAVQYQSAAQKGLALTPLKGMELTNEVYTVNVRKEGGLGLVLAEMWAAADGPGVVEASTRAERGLVLVEEIVEGSNAAAALPAIEIGDTIIAVTSPKGGTVDTEGLNWDATVGALGGAGGDEITLMMKRLVPRATVTVKVTGSDGSDLGVFEAAAGSVRFGSGSSASPPLPCRRRRRHLCCRITAAPVCPRVNSPQLHAPHRRCSTARVEPAHGVPAPRAPKR